MRSFTGWPAVISRLKESSRRKIVQQSTHFSATPAEFQLRPLTALSAATGELDLSLASDAIAVGTALTDHFGRIGNEKGIPESLQKGDFWGTIPWHGSRVSNWAGSGSAAP